MMVPSERKKAIDFIWAGYKKFEESENFENSNFFIVVLVYPSFIKTPKRFPQNTSFTFGRIVLLF
jgi:hypothetical protein